MFRLEEKILEWRRQMRAAGIATPQPLDELETHLREDFRALVAAGKPEEESFQLASSRLGHPGPLRTEFGKLKNPVWWPVTAGSWLFAVALVLLAIKLSQKVFDGKLGLLLFAHIVSVTAGYGAAFLTGGFGIIYVCSRMSAASPPPRRLSLDRAVLRFSQVSAGTVILGFVLGMVWLRQRTGKFLMGDAKEIGALCVILWFVALAVMQRRRWINERATMLMGIVGNIVVSLAWFGAAILEGKAPGFMPLALCIFLGIHGVLLVLGLAPSARAES